MKKPYKQTRFHGIDMATVNCTRIHTGIEIPREVIERAITAMHEVKYEDSGLCRTCACWDHGPYPTGCTLQDSIHELQHLLDGNQ